MIGMGFFDQPQNRNSAVETFCDQPVPIMSPLFANLTKSEVGLLRLKEQLMSKMILIGAMALALVGCNATQRGATVGAGTGGVIGAIATGSAGGAAIGAAAGGLAGALIGRASEDNKCRYRDRRGRVYVDDC